MGHVPAYVRWYLADLVVEHRIDGDPRNVVHIDTHLVRADSAEEACSKALALGEDQNFEFENTDDRSVSVSFRGLGDLLAIYEDLEDGSELIYSEKIGLSEAQVLELIRSKEAHTVFSEPPPIEGPNDMPKDIMAQAIEALGGCDLNDGNQRRDDQS